MTIVALLELSFRADKLSVAPGILQEILTDTRAFDGCLGVEVLEDVADPAHVVVVEEWASLEHDAAYRAWRAGDGASPLGELLSGPPNLTKFVKRV